MKICVIGTGYVGLVAGACLAETGNSIICVDVDKHKIERLKKGELPIYEPNLEELVARNLAEGNLAFSSDVEMGILESLVIFIAVGTPPKEDGSADLKHVCEVAETIGKAMNGFKIIVNKSTVPVGTADIVREIVLKHARHPFEVVSNPEFLKEGAAVNDFMYPDRVVIGTTNDKAREIMTEMYTPFVRTENPLIFMDNRSAEVTKYASNAMLATKISFMNEMANLCEKVGADVNMVRKGMGADKRIGYQFLFPGVGYGGSCFPKDVKAIIRTAHEHAFEMTILAAVENVNQKQKIIFIEKLLTHFDRDLKDKVIGIWGLSFKPNTNDIREAPAVAIISRLLQEKCQIRVCDPIAIPDVKEIFGDQIHYCKDKYEAVIGADALIVVTEWNHFRHPDFAKIKNLMRTPVLFDGRNLYKPQKVQESGIAYYCVGRKG